MRKATGFAAIVACLFIWSGLAAGGGAAAPSKVAWSKCFAQFGPFECGTVQVPLDYDQPNGRTISIALARLPATDQAHRIGSLLLNPGGPGGSGVDFVVGAGPSLFTPRGACALRPRRLRPARDRPQHGAALLRHRPGSGAVLHAVRVPLDARGGADLDRGRPLLDDACARRGGSIAEHMSTANVARDMDAPAPGGRRRQADVLRRLVRLATSASPTRTCSRTRCARSSSTACSTRSRGRPASATRRRRCRSRRGCRATLARRRRWRSSSGCATRAGRRARSGRAPPTASPRSRHGSGAPGRSRSRTGGARRSTTRF